MQFRGSLFGWVLTFFAFCSLVQADEPCRFYLLGSTPEQIAYEVNAERGEQLARNSTRPVASLDVATWNLNLLKVNWSALSKVPLPAFTARDYAERAELIFVLLNQYLHSPDAPQVIGFQEAWTAEDHLALLRIAQSAGYVPAERNLQELVRHGLQLLIRKDAVSEIRDSGFFRFENRKGLATFERAGRVRRGLLWTRVVLKNGQSVLFGDTHLTPFPMYHKQRASQLSALGQGLPNLSRGLDHLVIIGDLNIASDYEVRRSRDIGTLAKARKLYQNFGEVTNLRDTWRAVHALNPQDPGYTFNPDFPPLISENVPLIGHWLATRFPMRVDYIWAGERNPKANLYVSDSKLMFTEKIDVGQRANGNGLYPSDHCLVRSALRFW